MPKLEANALNPNELFDLDGIPYGKALCVVVYDNIILNSKTEYDLSNIRVGLQTTKETVRSRIIQRPVPVGAWTNELGEEYTSLSDLISDMNRIITFK